MPNVIIDYEKCEGTECGECAEVCSMEVLAIEGDKITVKNQDGCSLCEICTDVCPNEAIKLVD